jgi:predicted metal-dependent TIM-barrel fold hydrolase
VAVVGLDNNGKTAKSLVSLLLDLSKTLGDYTQETGIQVLAKVGIHSENIPTKIANNPKNIEEAWMSMGMLLLSHQFQTF